MLPFPLWLKRLNQPRPIFSSVLANDFDISTATGNNDLILGLFTAIRTTTGNDSWRLSNKDYTLCKSFLFDSPIEDLNDINNFQSFLTDELIPERGTKDSFSYSYAIRFGTHTIHILQATIKQAKQRLIKVE